MFCGSCKTSDISFLMSILLFYAYKMRRSPGSVFFFFYGGNNFFFFFLNHCRSSDQMVWWHLNYCLLLLCCPSKALVKVLTWNYHTLNYNFLFHHVSSWLGLGKNKIWSKVWNTSWIELKSIHFTMTLSPSWPPFCWLPWSYNLYWQNFVKTSDCGHIWGEDGLTL